MGKKRQKNRQKQRNRANSAIASNWGVQGLLEQRPFQLLLLLVVTALAYAHALDAPFYLDDYPSIRENPAIRDIGDWQAIFAFAQQRFLGYLTFAINYAWHGYDVGGYHLVNLLIHCATAVSVYYLVCQILVTPVLLNKVDSVVVKCLPLLAALLFALHPLQTQAVTYIVQRLASMAALFYLLSLLSYLGGRLSSDKTSRLTLFALTFVFAIAAIATKQNAVTLPAAILLFEILLFGLWGMRLVRVIAAIVVPSLLVLVFLYFSSGSEFFASLSAATQETQLVTRAQYLAIQMGVIWIYIGKFLFPYPLHLEYDIQPTSFAAAEVWVLAAGHVLLIGLAIWQRRKYPLLALGILFYYLTLSVESSIIPIRDFAFEHRTYLPNFGLCLIVATLMLRFLPRLLTSRQAVTVVAVLLMTLLLTTWMRNNVWRDPEAFARHEIAVSPGVLRPWALLGETLLRQNRDQEAVQAYLDGLDAFDTSLNRNNNTVIAYYQNLAQALNRVGRYEDALNVLNEYDWRTLGPREQSAALAVRGNIHAAQMQVVQAQQDFEEALELNPNNANAMLSLGKVMYMQAQLDDSKEILNRFLNAAPSHPFRHEAVEILQLIDQLQSQ